MIIKTQRTPLAYTIDTALTALGWLGFFYLFTKGLVSIINGSYDSPATPLIQTFMPTVNTLMVYLLVAAFNATLVVLWARFHKTLFGRLSRHSTQQGVDDESVASHFHLSCNQLHEIQDSRVTVIYHSMDGNIAHLETDQLRMQPAGNNNVFVTARVA